MIHEIEGKTLLSHVRQPDTYFGLRYNMNLYRGCQHGCIYCDSRSLCYGIEKFSDVLVKVNAIDLLRDELPRKRQKGTIGTGAMSDPYTHVERKYNLMGQALVVIAEYGFPIHILTKGDMVLKDIAALKVIQARAQALVTFTITTTDDDLARKIEPGAPPSSARFKAMAALAEVGILTGVTLMPVLPFITDTVENIRGIVAQTAAHGGSYMIPAFGMTLRDRQRAHYYDHLDKYFPGLRQRYIQSFGGDYGASAPNARMLRDAFYASCDVHDVAPRVPLYQSNEPRQLALF